MIPNHEIAELLSGGQGWTRCFPYRRGAVSGVLVAALALFCFPVGQALAQDDQRPYLPTLERVKRIGASARSGSFIGSEFSYEDMSAPEVEEYTCRHLRDQPCGELTCTVTEQFPLDEKSGYSRKIIWQDTGDPRTWKMELYDRRDSHLKTVTFAEYDQYPDRYWRASEQTMVNHLTGASTVPDWRDFQFGTGLEDGEFIQTALRRVR